MGFVTDAIVQRRRIRTYTALLVVFGLVLASRLVYLQIVQHAGYLAQASNEHTRKYEIPAKRGELYVHDGDSTSPIALNQSLQLVYADPRYVTDKAATAAKLASVLGGSMQTYLNRLNNGIEYAELAQRVPSALADKVRALDLVGVGLTERDYRSYPEGPLAAQVLGFVNADGAGQYGVEGYLDDALAGTAGQLAAKTDTHGIPIATANNVVKPPKDGTSYVLTIDRNIQAMAEQELASQVEKVKAKSGSIIVMDPTGAVRAMANYPTYDPNSYNTVTDYSVFENQVVSNQFEPGSGMKAFTMATGLDQSKVTPDTTYDDPGCVKVDDRQVCNAEGDKPGKNKTMTDVLKNSLNTGVMFVLRMMGGNAEKITLNGKKLLYDYFTKHFGFGTRTGIEQSGEAAGSLVQPSNAAGNDVTYANMTFGQGMSVTMVQMAEAMAAIANGGTLYQPRLIDGIMNLDGTVTPAKPKVVTSHVMSPSSIASLNAMLQVVVQHGSGYLAARENPGYKIAGKTGTAQIPKSDGTGYVDGANIGSFIGFAPADNPKFIVMVRINEPNVNCDSVACGYAEYTTVPVFGDVVRWLFSYYGIPPSS
ncbi:MAG TPA: penicillin-binding protein 2 [Candidatus Saccharimonadia bacterium]|jgi:cell division protein FtsI/penicillin-binding protein 2|nr:penicillin-binding protein 2 [Candidatus Saccharimonadia bacterium]